MKDRWLRLWEKHSRMYFMTYTNGTLLDEDTVQALAQLGNVSPAISLEGFREETDRRRGAGVFDAALASMQRLTAAGVPFGVSVTYTRENSETVGSEEFIRFCIERGALYGWYFMFVPVGKDPVLDLVPTPEQRLEVGRRVREARQRLPIFLADFWNDGPSVGGCLAGGRLYLHVVNSGRVEPCVFAHFGVDNIRDTTLLEAANSPFFRDIRARHPYNENGNLLRPCMIVDNPAVLRELVDRHLVPQGHEHSEDIIHDPEVVAWIDRYSERFRELTDPLWEAEIQDPDGRWYWDGPEFRRLFRNADRADSPPRPSVRQEASG
jgi:MoaA/NifB/PqqE/SkfB family radical SAM enzyme